MWLFASTQFHKAPRDEAHLGLYLTEDGQLIRAAHKPHSCLPNPPAHLEEVSKFHNPEGFARHSAPSGTDTHAPLCSLPLRCNIRNRPITNLILFIGCAEACMASASKHTDSHPLVLTNRQKGASRSWQWPFVAKTVPQQ